MANPKLVEVLVIITFMIFFSGILIWYYYLRKRQAGEWCGRCELGLECQNGICIVPVGNCSDDNQCPGDQVCSSGNCLAKEMSCLKDSDCGGKVCHNGVCVAPNLVKCSTDSQCPVGYKCSSGSCVVTSPTSVHCVTSGECRNNAYFLPTSECVAGYCT